MISQIILKNRSYRRFDESFQISDSTLREFVDMARLSPSGRNAQPLKYILVNDPEKNQVVFKTLSWAGYFKDWHPKQGERPSAYTIVLGDKSISNNYFCDHGIAAQSILLGAVEKGLGGCIIMTIQRENLRKELNIPDIYDILMIIALGKPIEEIVIEPIANEDIKYWRDDKQVHHVPKRSLDDIILKI